MTEGTSLALTGPSNGFAETLALILDETDSTQHDRHTGDRHMGIFMVLGYALGLLPQIVLTIQKVHGDAVSGADKRQMAKDALSGALGGALTVLPAGSTNAGLAQAAGATASNAIDIIMGHVTEFDSIGAAVNLTKADGRYQVATAKSQEALKANCDPPPETVAK